MTTTSDTAATPPTMPTTPTAPGTPGTGTGSVPRLGQGELRRRVAAHLVARPGEAFTPGEIARTLGRSSGAVANALSTLLRNGQAEQVGANPRRFRALPATVHATTTGGTAGSAEPVKAASPTHSPPASPPNSPASGPATAPPAAPTAERSFRRGETVTRPNGQAYYPRTLADLPDVAALQKLRAASIPALLYGPPGTGKTSLIEAAFPDLITVAGDGDTTVSDFIGEYTQAAGGGYEFVYGPLVTAMTEGRALLIDDATLISPKVLAVVYPAMDGRRQIIVKAHKGETITATPGFYVVAGHNPGVHGAVLTEALASRFAAQIRVSTDYDLARTLKIEPRAVRVARNLAKRQESGEIGWAPQLRELIAFQKIAGVLGPEAAVANLLGVAPEDDREVVAEVLSAVYGRAITPLSLGQQI
ncbi:AAA family ATPase [Actinomadura gamaensis]|uniref:AAA family ATPase n=1 Tax=Actinomadura gamaensis TaxID=1763541 RepID=A0ABV9U8S4_9ACTN